MDVMKFNYTKKEAAYSLGVCVRTVDHLIHRGDLETKRIGKRVLIPREVLRRYAAGDHPEATNLNEPSGSDRKAKKSRISEATQG
jgi:excisionase family DNA binding protein